MALLAQVLSLLLELLEALPPHTARSGSKGVAAEALAVRGGGRDSPLQGHYGPTYSRQGSGGVHEGQQLGSLANLTTLGAAALGCIACLDLCEEAIEATAHFGAATEAEAPEAAAEY
tara:strand:+ start:161 stop:511 length:351 start_codon:yes stop_codon:yes gene_type:complete